MRTHIYVSLLFSVFTLIIAAPLPEPYSAGIDGTTSDVTPLDSTFFTNAGSEGGNA
ncbi:hypothetical protein C8Q75DRAFT_811199 [Abortiporus biennis]|nr:hypothetical protein C8Q75DRAFT_811199 [Abortiporus biennis]